MQELRGKDGELPAAHTGQETFITEVMLLQAIENWLQDKPATDEPVRLHVALSYFNSSSTKLLFELFECLNGFAKGGIACELHWYYDEEDDISEEFGQELRIDFPSLAVFLIPDLDAC